MRTNKRTNKRTNMRILIDMGHPAHVHFFKNAIRELENRGHKVKITARDKDVTLQLLDAYGFEYEVRPSGWRPLNLLLATRFVRNIGREFGADVLVGVHNPYIAGAAVKLKKRCVLFTDTPGTKFVNRISVDRATTVVTPECLAGMFPNQVTYPGYKEMAYLHPKLFTPDRTILSKYGFAVDEPFFIIRFIEWSAYHDSGVKGITDTQKAELIENLSKHGKVIASVEGNALLPAGAIKVKDPADVHSLLALSSGYVGEGATMAKEAAILGVSSVYVSPIKGLPPIDELVKNGRMSVMDRLDSQAIPNALGNRKEPSEMYDLTGEIVRLMGGQY